MSVHPDMEKWNAETMLEDQDSAYYYWQRILQLRKKYKDIFVYGDFEMLDVNNEFPNVVAYLRRDNSPESAGNEKSICLVIANFSKERLWWRVPKPAEKVLFEEHGLRPSAIRQELRNYIGSSAGDNATEKDDRGWKIELMEWKVVVAMD